MAKWKDEFFADLIPRGQRAGIGQWDRDRVHKLILSQAKQEVSNEYADVIARHYVKASTFTELGMKKLLNATEKVWPGYKPPVRRKNLKRTPRSPATPKPQKAPPPPPAPLDWGGPPPQPGVAPPPPSQSSELPPPPPPPSQSSELPPPPPPPPPLTHGPACTHEDIEPQQGGENPFCKGCGEIFPTEEDGQADIDAYNAPDDRCVACGDTGKNSNGGSCYACQKKKGSPPPKPLEVPLPPMPAGQTYGPGESSTSSLENPQRCRGCIAVRMKAIPNRNLDSAVVTETLHRYVVGVTGFGAVIKDATPLHDDWWDLLIEYSIHIATIYEALLRHEWIEDAVAKPAGDFGVRTSATS